DEHDPDGAQPDLEGPDRERRPGPQRHRDGDGVHPRRTSEVTGRVMVATWPLTKRVRVWNVLAFARKLRCSGKRCLSRCVMEWPTNHIDTTAVIVPSS